MERLASELVAATERLYAAYEQYTEKKEDGGAELTPVDERLGVEIEALQESASRFYGRLRDGFFSRTRARLRRQDAAARRGEVQRRLRDLAQAADRVDRLIAEVQPGGSLQEAWRDVQTRGRQLVALGPLGFPEGQRPSTWTLLPF